MSYNCLCKTLLQIWIDDIIKKKKKINTDDNKCLTTSFDQYISGVVGDTYTRQLHCSLGIPSATFVSLFSQILASFYFISSLR